MLNRAHPPAGGGAGEVTFTPLETHSRGSLGVRPKPRLPASSNVCAKGTLGFQQATHIIPVWMPSQRHN